MPIPLTLQERFALGRQQRKHMRRADHAGFTPQSRTASPLELLRASYRGRVPSLQAEKDRRMAASPFAFFRGAVCVMASDLSLAPNTGIHTQLCGDAHVSNLGAFEGPGGELLFDLNDFDETISGPFEWDVKRMATSLILAGLGAGASDSRCHDAVSAFLQSYRRSILRFAAMPVLELARYQVHRITHFSPVQQIFAAALRSTPAHNLLSLTEPVATTGTARRAKAKPADTRPPARHAGGKRSETEETTVPQASQSVQPRVFQSHPPLLTRITGVSAQRITDSLTPYADSLQPERRHFLAQYRPIDVAFKVVGTGSVGLRDYCIYLEGNGTSDPLFLQIKEETTSAYAPYLGKQRSTPSHQGQRVVQGERAMQLQSDSFLGWTTIEGREYLVRQFNDHKAAIDITQLRSSALLEYATVCGEILARGHARAGDPIILTGYLGSSARFDKAISRFAVAYAQQMEIDWKHFVRATGSAQTPSKTKAIESIQAKSTQATTRKAKPAPRSKTDRRTSTGSKRKS